MYHLIKFIKLTSIDNCIDNNLIASNDKIIRNNINQEKKRLLLKFGIIEVLPFSTGLGLSLTINQIIFQFDYLFLGLFITIVLILLFKSKIPKIPIGLKNKII